jgi:hypothetical protein
MANSNNYPFMTKKQIAARIETDLDFVQECVLVMQARQTEDEQEVKETRHKNKRGWMSSHAVNGGKLADKLAAGEALTDEELGKAQGMVCRYTKQLAAHFRAAAIVANPDLEAVAEVFSAS